ncbi:MAG: hydroxyacid dehydrogenase [Oscillospiraceae bacterium]|nr:hydroxyacid dehydrogenase [Oscillospiraceae bacterium]
MNNVIFLTQQPGHIANVYAMAAQDIKKSPLLTAPEHLPQVEFIFSTWGMPSMSEDEVREHFPALKAVFYAAGSVQHFARPFLACGVQIFSAWAANAVPVAEVCLAQILLANKGFYQSAAMQKQQQRQLGREFTNAQPGNYGATVGLIGCGMIGRYTAQLLQQFDVHVLACDPYTQIDGVEKSCLEELFSRCNTISNHLPDNEKTRSMLGYDLFKRMLPNATFINTGRGAQVIEADLIRALQEEPARTAVLDVTDPEPPAPKSPLYTLPNVVLTPHIAGSTGQEVARMGSYMLAAHADFLAGKPSPHEVTLEMLENMA